MTDSYMTFWLTVAAVFLVALGLIWRELRQGRQGKILHLCNRCGWVGSKPQHDKPYKRIACCYDAVPVN